MPRDRAVPAVSVIVPIYRVEAYVGDCIRSLAAQSFRDFEVILVNDASPDHSLGVALAEAPGLPACRVIDLPVNGGLGRARNAGIDAARGRYLMFLDSDDWLDPDALARITARADAVQADVVIFDFVRAYPDGRRVRVEERGPYAAAGLPVFDPMDQPSSLQIFNLAQIRACRAGFVRDLGLRFTPDVIYEDIDWTFRLMTAARRAAIIDAPLYIYRAERPGSILNTPGRQHFDIIGQCARVFDALPKDCPAPVFQAIYGYLINSVFFVLMASPRVPAADRAAFFAKAGSVFARARADREAGRDMAVTFMDRGWFETALITGDLAGAIALYEQRFGKVPG